MNGSATKRRGRCGTGERGKAERALQDRVICSRRGRLRFDSARNFDGSDLQGGARNETGGERGRRWRQHKRQRCNHDLVRILAASHRAVHHPGHAVVAFFARCGMRWRLGVMVLWYVAKPSRAARHAMAGPSSRRKRRIQENHRQQARKRGEHSVAILKVAVHDHVFQTHKS
jgi:hypothetical protein